MHDLKISLIQSELFWENQAANLEMFSKKIDSISDQTDLILLPEMFTTGFTMHASANAEKMNGATMQWMKSIAIRKNCVVAGSIIIQDGEKFYNRLIWMRPDWFSIYDKRHLFRLAGEEEVYTAGKDRLVEKIKGWKIAPLICYDLRFPVWSRRSDEFNYDLLIYVANWPERRNIAWKQLLPARAIENQSYVVGLNRIGNDGNDISHTGDSTLIDFSGNAIASMNSEARVTTLTLSMQNLYDYRKQFAFYDDRDRFKIAG